ncbi:MAG: FtsX-like permease family protein [Ilumatobacter sp.]
MNAATLTAANQRTSGGTRPEKGLSGMSAVTMKGLWANKSRFGLSAFAVIISVAFLTGMLILTSAIGGTASDDLASANAGVDVVVLGESLGSGEGPPGAEATIRAAVSSDVVTALQGADGVIDAAGIRTGSAQLVDLNGALLGTSAQQALGETWVSNTTLSPFELSTGDAPSATGVVIDAFTARETGLEVGDQVRVVTESSSALMNVNGIANYGGGEGQPDTSTLLFADSTTMLGTDGFDRVVVETSLDVSTVSTLLAEAGNDVVDVQSGVDYVADLQSLADTQATFQSTFLLAFALIALVAGTTIIYNTFVIAVAQRTRELALLRSIGASRRQILSAVMIESAVIGLVASIMGAAAGIGTAFGLLALFDAIGFTITTAPLVIPASSVIIGMVVGVVVSLVSAFVPARKAAGTPPIAALRDAAVDPSGLSPTRNVVGGVLLLGGVAASVVGAVVETWEIAVGGVLAAFVGVIVGGPMMSGWFSRSIAGPAETLGGTVGRLAGTNAARNARRSASTALSLTLGVTLIAFFTVVVSSLSGSTASDTKAAMQADVVISSLFSGGGPDDITNVPGSVADAIPVGDGVEVVVPIASTIAIEDGSGVFVAGVDVDALGEVYRLDVTAGSLGDVTADSIAVQVDAADGLGVGDELRLTFPGAGEQTLTIAALYDNDLPGLAPPRFVFEAAAFAELAPDAGDSLVLARTDGSDQAFAAVAAAADGTRVQTSEQFIDSMGSMVDAFRNFVYGMLAVAVFIALVGIANTTVMAIGERTREIGMLRAVGMTAKQVRQMVRSEALMLSIQGSLLGLALGVGGSYAVFTAIGDGGLTLTLPITSLVIIGLGGAVSGVLAAAWPAWRAARMEPLEAMVA